MSFWTGGGRGDSPHSSTSSGHAQSKFYFGEGSPSEEGEDEDAVAYGLFDKERLAAYADGGSGSSSSALGLTSMDFWHMDGLSPAGGRDSGAVAAAASSSAQQQASMFIKQEELDDEVDNSATMLRRLLQQSDSSGSGNVAGLPMSASSPTSMDFDELVAADAFAPASGSQQMPDGPIASSTFAAAAARPSMQSAFDASTLYPQDLPTSGFGSPAGTTTANGSLHGILRAQLAGSSNPQTIASAAIFSPQMSPQSLLQQLSSSNTSEQNSGSSRSSSANPPTTGQTAPTSSFGFADSGSSEEEKPSIAAVMPAARTHSSTSLKDIPVNAQASTSSTTSSLKQSKSATSLASSSGMKISSTSSSTPKEAHSTTSLTTLADKNASLATSETSALIKTLARDEEARNGPAQLVILGLPEEGARSRVETQVKVGISLVRPKRRGTNPPSILNYRDSKGGLTPEADQHFERIGTWRYLSLPTVSAVKRKAKKHYRSDVPPEETLFADIKVVSATEPAKEIFICNNCQQREYKRLQRKTQNRSKPSQDVDSGKEDEKGYTEDQLAKRKIVLFNCGKYLDFHNGEVVVPTRITCYCRHHKEKYGFTIVYTLTDHLGRVVANATSPAIFLTDDHKARPTKPDGTAMGSIPSLASVANGPHASTSASNSAWNSATGSRASSVQSSAASSQVGSAASSANPSRNNSYENLDDLHHAANTSTGSTQHGRAKRDRTSKPYSMEARPAKPKRTNSMNRLNSFAMTPLSMSAPTSPKLSSKSTLAPMTALSPEYLNQADGALQNFADLLNNSSLSSSGLPETHPSPGSSLSAPSTPGASLESFGSSFPQNALHYGQGSTTSLSDDLVSNGSRSVEQSPAYGGFVLPLPEQGMGSNSLAQHLASLEVNAANMQAPMPKISRLIPAEGPVHGGIEVIILGENFSPGLEVMFGEAPAVSTQAWGANTIMCVLPPSASPGPVVVGFKNLQMHMAGGAGLQLFTYLDTSDKALMELALQVVGMKMTGRIDDARSVARRIIAGNGATGDPANNMQMSPQAGQGGFAPTGLQMSKSSLALHDQLASMGETGGTKDLQSTVVKLLSLMDVDLEEEESETVEAPCKAIDHANEQHHSLLHLATVLGFNILVSFLIERGIDLDKRDKNGYTALHMAALRGRVAVTRLLLHAGADLELRTNTGETALEIAHSRDQVDVADLYPRRLCSPRRSRPSLAGPSTPRQGEACFPTPRRKKLFSLSQQDTDEESESEWSSEEDACFASESDVDEHLSRVSSAVSIRTRVRSRAQSVLQQQTFAEGSDSETDLSRDPDAGSKLSDAKIATNKPRWLQAAFFSGLWSHGSSRNHAVPSTSPSAKSLSLSSISGSSLGQSQQDSEAEDWPTAALFGQSGQRYSKELRSIRANLSKRLGYPLENLTEDALRSYSYHANKYGRLGRDRMLYFFWLPLFFIAIFWTFHQASHAINTTLLSMQKAAKLKLQL